MRFLFVDRIIESSPGEFIRGLKHITQDDRCLTLDKQGQPCFISSLIGETLGQLAAWNVMAHNDFSLRPVAGVVASARVCRPAYLGETLLLESYIDAVDDTAVQYHSIARVGNEPVFIIEGALGPLLPMTDFISSQEVRAQYQEIYRPGDWAQISSSVNSDIPHTLDMNILPYTAMTFDRLIDSIPGESISAEKRITRAAPYFPDHFPKKPVLPMTVLLECIQQLTEQFLIIASLTERYQIVELRRIKMNVFVQPGEVVLCSMKVKQQSHHELILACRCEVEGKRVCVVEVVLNAKG
ncbi:hydroxymyristoyl-ACP dehydratase [Legionella sp. km772]|uniref:hydroxymyristoyl-ACP dehydratase n=1 Tax=Legionella sp. km772 TaxID=2498111 RepID=UPI000F8E7141|nr:hydroxymyristoyl-ACP dehydratase [Legionella sp. km772]RUR13411.1 hydroxymyristoyl-ACP dehydratase [Legionella sp. km772]